MVKCPIPERCFAAEERFEKEIISMDKEAKVYKGRYCTLLNEIYFKNGCPFFKPFKEWRWNGEEWVKRDGY